jgi:hypothetical protein
MSMGGSIQIEQLFGRDEDISIFIVSEVHIL